MKVGQNISDVDKNLSHNKDKDKDCDERHCRISLTSQLTVTWK